MTQKVRRQKFTIAVILLRILIVAMLLFIWGNSLESIPESQAKSLNIAEMVKPFLEPIVGLGNVTDHLVRKLAHFIEFGLLGVLLALRAVVRCKLKL